MVAAASFVALSLSASALATVFVTSPTASSTFNGGQQATISWQDDGSSPNLAAFGPSMISIYTGNSQQQTNLQAITQTDVSKVASIVFTPNPSIGPNADEYFVRFESLSAKDAKNPQYPALAFSAKFTMANMQGNFNASVQAQIDGQSTAPIGGGTVAPGAASTPAAASPTPSGLTPSKASSPSSPSGTSKVGATSKNSTSSAFKTVGGVSGSALLGLGAMAAVVLY